MSAVFTRLKVWTLLLLMFVCAGSYLAAQPHLVFKRITVDNGLPQNTIMSVLQDKTGYIWISTNDGVCKYNGIDFKIYKHSDDDPASLSNNQVNKIFEDSRGNIWIGTFNGLNLYDRGRDAQAAAGCPARGPRGCGTAPSRPRCRRATAAWRAARRRWRA